MKRLRGFTLLNAWLLSACCLASGVIFAQPLYTVLGNVYDDRNNPLEGVTVFLHELNAVYYTDVAGKFEFQSVKPGNYHLHLTLGGYVARHENIRVSDSGLRLSYTLKKTSVELHNVVVEESILKSGQKEQSQTVHAVDGDFMLRNGNFSFARMLESIPGVTSISTGTGISKPVIRGLGFNRVVVAENGIKQEGQQWGGDHGLEIDQFAVERVEVIKGPSSLLYGSDGLGGVINIRPGPFPKLNTVEASALLTARSVNDLLGSSAMVSVNRNNRFVRVRFSMQDYGDYRVPADSFTYNSYRLPLVDRRLKNTAGQERNVQLMAGINRNWGFSTLTLSRYELHSGLFAGAHGIPRSYQLTGDGDSRNIGLPNQHTEHWKALSNTNLLIGRNWLEMDAGYQFNHRREHSVPHAHGLGPRPEGTTELELKLHTFSLNLRYHLEHSDKLKSVAGLSGQLQQNGFGGFRFLVPEYNSFTAGAFWFSTLTLRNTFIINGGIRYDYGILHTRRYLAPVYADLVTITGYTEQSPELKRRFGNVSGSTGFSWFPAEKWNIKFNLGSSFRMPTAPELTTNGIHHGAFRHETGDSTLVSERGYQSDLSLIRESGKWMLSVTPFFNYFSHYIFLDPTSEFSPLPDAGLLYRYSQADALHTGAELHSDIHLTRALHAGLTAQYVYAYNLESSYPLPFIPPAQLRIELEYEWESLGKWLPALQAGINLQSAATQHHVARNEPATPGFTLLNFTSSARIKTGKQEIKLLFSIQNLLNSHYLAHLNRYRILNLPEPGRNFLITCVIPFKVAIYRDPTTR